MLLPDAPLHSAIDPTTQTAVTSVMGALAGLALLFALGHWRRTGRPTFLLLFVAGGAMMLFEPMVDTVGGVWFPRENSHVAFTLYGRPIPVWLCLTYFAFFGILVPAVWSALRRGVTRRKLWTLYAACALADVVMEVILLHFDTYIYYADQPLVLLEFPFWWAPVNGLIVLAAASAVLRLEPLLAGARQLLIVPIALTASAAVNACAGWPSWLVINSDLGWAGTQAGGLATYALALWLMGGLVAVLTGPAVARAPAPDAAGNHVNDRSFFGSVGAYAGTSRGETT
jgi:hypothetical protein